MNIFATNPDPEISARELADRHVVKMVLETAQMLSAAVLHYDSTVDGLYRATHINHPCTQWVRASRSAFMWAVSHGLSLADEYESRYGKPHKTKTVIDLCASYAHLIPDTPMPPFAMAMPDEYKCAADPHAAYRNYLRSKYATWGHMARWTKSSPPLWIVPSAADVTKSASTP